VELFADIALAENYWDYCSAADRMLFRRPSQPVWPRSVVHKALSERLRNCSGCLSRRDQRQATSARRRGRYRLGCRDSAHKQKTNDPPESFRLSASMPSSGKFVVSRVRGTGSILSKRIASLQYKLCTNRHLKRLPVVSRIFNRLKTCPTSGWEYIDNSTRIATAILPLQGGISARDHCH
jgi:hypothetical protein